jgi:hypothetical protein
VVVVVVVMVFVAGFKEGEAGFEVGEGGLGG